MNNRHPGLYIQQELTKRGRTQKDFARILGKKVSEVNELIKGKRNITIQRDILLCAIFDTAPQKWIDLQMEYDYVTSSQSVDMQKIEDIKSRKNLLEEIKGKTQEESQKPKEKEKAKEIIADPIAYKQESPTIQATKDKHKEHEIFRNF